MLENTELTSALAGFVIPLLVGLLAKLNAPKSVKAILNLGLSTLPGVLTAVNGDDGAAVVTTFLLTWATSVASYYGLWKPTGVAGEVQAKTANFGVGARTA